MLAGQPSGTPDRDLPEALTMDEQSHSDAATEAPPRWESDARFWIEHELGQAIAPVTRIRMVAGVGAVFLAAFFWAVEPTVWRSWVLLVGVAPLMVLGLVELRWFEEPRFTPSRISYFMGSVLWFQTVAIVCTGGIDSPIIFIWVPWAVLAAFAYGEFRHFLLAATAPVLLVATLVVYRYSGATDTLIPEVLGGPDAVIRNDAYLWTFAGALTFIMLLTGFIALRLRRGLNRAVGAAALARHEAVQTMRERNRELYQLSGALAHELKNPLASIQGLAGLLARKAEPDTKTGEQLEVLLGEVKRMSTVLDEFLNFSRPADSLAVRAVDPARLIAEVASLHEGVAAERGVDIAVAAGSSVPIHADPRKLKQVLVNLVQNALEASPRGSAIRLAVEHAANGDTRFAVEDRGPGVHPDVGDRLFHPGTTTKPEGSGLGLVIARSIAEQHGGTLSLEPRAGGGCRAVFRLPPSPIADAPAPSGEPTDPTPPGEQP